MRAFALIAALASAAGASAPLAPVPAACTSTLIDTVQADMSEREARVKALAARVRSEKILLVAESRALFVRPDANPPPGVRDPFFYADRFEALRPRLTEKNWSRGVELWADWLERAEAAWERVDAAEYCGLREEGRSFAQDGYLMFLPFIAAAHGNDEFMPVFHLAAASGAISLGLDVITFVPNVALSTGQKLSKNAHIRKAARSFRRFADFVEAREKERGAGL